jgi:predicted amidohydrolase YtcJ
MEHTIPPDGRIIDGDADLRRWTRGQPPDLAPVAAELLRFGVTGVTDATPDNDVSAFHRLVSANLPQRLLVMGGQALADAPATGRVMVGPRKFHHHDHDLPDLETFARDMALAHAKDRPVAVHCVTPAELLLTLAALEEAGVHGADRIEHGALIGPEALEWIASLGVTVVSQPHFLRERGAAYRTDVPRDEQSWLYRLASIKRAGAPVAAGSDAPFGGLDPWRIMAAAVDRPGGFGENEAVGPEEALALFTGPADAPGGQPRVVAPGATADLCLLDRSWAEARRALATVQVRATLIDGEIAYADPVLAPQWALRSS